MYPSAELSSSVPVPMPGFELVAVMVSAVPGQSHVPLGARRSVWRNAGIIQLAVAVRLHGGTRSRSGQGMIGCREARFGGRSTQTGSRDVDPFFAEHSGVGDAADASGCLSSKMQAAATDLFSWMRTFARGAVGIKLHGMSIEYEIPAAGSCARAYNLV